MPYKNRRLMRPAKPPKKIRRTTWDALRAATVDEMLDLMNDIDGQFVKDPIVFNGELIAFVGKTEWVVPEEPDTDATRESPAEKPA